MSTLRSLLSVPEDAILTTYLHSLDDVTAKARVYTLLTNPYPSPTLQEEVTLLLKQEGLPSLFKAALSFLLFSLVVEGTRAEDPKRFELPNRMLDQAGVASFIYEFYDVDPFWRKPQLSLHQMGTTSYILRLRNEPKVLKIIKPRYLTDQTIAFNTENYKGRYSALSDSPYTPTIEISTSRYIVM